LIEVKGLSKRAGKKGMWAKRKKAKRKRQVELVAGMSSF